MHLFLFGTLRHLPLLEVVAGVALETLDIQPASLDGHRVAAVAGQPFPMLAADAGAAEGLLLSDLPEDVMARLDYYEAAFAYTRHDIEVLAGGATRAASVYLPEPERWTPDGLWSLEAWQDKWGALTVETAKEAMKLMAQGYAPTIMGQRYPQIMAREAGRMRGAATAVSGAMARSDVTLVSLTQPYANFFAAEEMELSFRRFDGEASEVVNRAVWASGDAALVLPYDPVRDRVLLIEQFRPGPYRRGDQSPWLVEPIAGRIDPGETPEDAVHREAMEEAGLSLSALHLVSSSYPSPGTTTEHFDIFIGIADLHDDVVGLGGITTEAEDIRSHLVDWASFDETLLAQGYRLVPLELAGHWLARNRDRLRASA